MLVSAGIRPVSTNQEPIRGRGLEMTTMADSMPGLTLIESIVRARSPVMTH